METPNYALVRALVGVLLFVDMLFYLPWIDVCFGEGYWGKSRFTSKAVVRLIALVWLATSGMLIAGVYPLAAAAILWVLMRRFYIQNRWKNPFRGGGAPGFMSHYTVLYIVLFEGARLLDATGELGRHVGTMLAFDFGVVLACSGSYKSLSGYLRGEGMEYGLANPFWGYWFKYFRKVRPSNPLLRAQDAFAAICQVTTGICLIVPPTRPLGAILCMFSFGYLLPTVRLGRLAVLMMVVPVMILPDLRQWVPFLPTFAPIATFAPVAAPSAVLTVLHALITTYVVLLGPVKVMQYLNLFAKVQLPGPIQTALTRYANTIPIIMWRVFTPDVTNFFVRIHVIDADGKKRPILDEDTYAYKQLLSRPAWSLRYLHVTESIALTTVFTTLKYFRSQRDLFEKRLVDYSRTLPVAEGEKLEYTFVAILKGEESFEYLPVSEFLVDPVAATVSEHKLVPDYAYDAPARHSHIKETVGYGSYVPKG
jgi:hypothetical protein